MNGNYIMHCGSVQVDRAQLADVSTPDPTDSWFPIPHLALVDQVRSAITNQGLRIVEEKHALWHEGLRYFGMLQVANGSNSTDYAYVVGLRNSNDRKFPAQLVVGATCFVCDNLSFSGEISISRRHTPNIMRDLPGLTTRACGLLSEKWNTMDTRIEAYRKRELTDPQVHDFLIRAFDAGVCPITQLPEVLNEWRHPRHIEFSQDRTAWRLFNAFTEVGKESSLWALPKRTINLHALLDAEVGLVGKREQIVGNATDVEVVVNQQN